MLYGSLVASALFLVVVFVVLFRAEKPFQSVVLTCALGTLASFVTGGLVLPPVTMQGLGMLVAAGLALGLFRSRLLFIPLALFSTGIAFTIAWQLALESERELKSRFPLESMADRLPNLPLRGAPLSRLSSQDLITWENEVADANVLVERSHERYHDALAKIHSELRLAFVNSPGFGIHRGAYLERELTWGSREPLPDPVPQPSPEPIPIWSIGDLPTDTPSWLNENKTEAFLTQNRRAVLNFANVEGFGFARNREAVGFKPHGIRYGIEIRDFPGYQLRSLNLVGLVVHPEPRVYNSKYLPRMDAVRDTPTRDLDGFEHAGLRALLAGEALFVREQADTVRVLGAIRSVSECIACHGGERGDLLGAFTYHFSKR